jgi:hypothetical protein
MVETKNKFVVHCWLRLTKYAAETVSDGPAQQDRVWRDRRRWATAVADAPCEALGKMGKSRNRVGTMAAQAAGNIAVLVLYKGKT